MYSGELTEFTCSICLNILHDPLLTRCEHMYCRKCIEDWLTQKNSCAVCRTEISNESLQPLPRLLANIFENVSVPCSFAEFGCKGLFKISQLKNHEDTCKFNPTSKWNCDGCGAPLNGSIANQHGCIDFLRTALNECEGKAKISFDSLDYAISVVRKIEIECLGKEIFFTHDQEVNTPALSGLNENDGERFDQLYKSVKKRVNKYHTEMDVLNQRVVSLRETNERLTAHSTEKENKLHSTISELNKQLVGKDNEITLLKDQLFTKISEIDALKQTAASSRKAESDEIRKAKSKNEKLEGELTGTRKSLTKLLDEQLNFHDYFMQYHKTAMETYNECLYESTSMVETIDDSRGSPQITHGVSSVTESSKSSAYEKMVTDLKPSTQQAALVNTLKEKGQVKSDQIVNVMKMVDRGNYCLQNAYNQKPAPIAQGINTSAPNMHAFMMEAIVSKLHNGAKALDIGSGSGYVTACMAMMCAPTGKVVGIESNFDIMSNSLKSVTADNKSELLNLKILEFVYGDGNKGWDTEAPYDAIHIGAAIPCVTDILLSQLKPGGILIAPVGSLQSQKLMKITKHAITGQTVSEELLSVIFGALTPSEKLEILVFLH